jgi:cytochrome c2
MTISRIEVNEYQCVKCGYKWINRVNGKEGPVPERCAKCKKHNWNSRKERITPEENGLRRRIKGMKQLHRYSSSYWNNPSIANCWNSKLADKFLNLNPRPSIAELRRVVDTPGLVIGLTSQNQYSWRGYVPDPRKPGWMKYDEKEYLKTLKLEAQKRQDTMQQIIKNRSFQSIPLQMHDFMRGEQQ